MQWEIITNGFSFNKYKKTYLNSLYDKLGIENKKYIDEEFQTRLEENKNLLSQCINPNKKDNKHISTGLALGLIQSGKTSSMEMVCNLARDNGYRVVIVLSGTVGSLTKQTKERLYQSTNGICWKRIYIPGANDEEQLTRGKKMENVSNEIINAFDTWDSDIYNHNEKRTVFILSMKGVKRLEKLHYLIKTLSEKDNRVAKVPVLIIDDECDHASLNRKRQSMNVQDDQSLIDLGYPPQFTEFKENQDIDDFLHDNSITAEELIYLNSDKLSDIADIKTNVSYQVSPNESATHRRIKHLRKFFKNSSYIGYTATPYANLLIDTWNNLSPNFAQVLHPGKDYTGSHFFFDKEENRKRFLRHVNPNELNELKDFHEYPKTLKKAIRLFITGIADGIKNKNHEKNKSRSMFVHISSETSEDIGEALSHEFIIKEINQDISNLKKLFDEGDQNNNSNEKIIIDEFLSAHEDLSEYANNIIKLNTNNFLYFQKAINFIEVIEFNAYEKMTIPKIHWNEEGYARILVGGTGLDRGYTVEGLTISYLLRNPSERLDTSLQRARFFGYHKSNLDYFRIFLPIISDNTFSDGSKTEYYLRNQIENYLKNPENNLVDWPRIFIGGNNADYQLTNPDRIGFDLYRSKNQFCIIRGNLMSEITEEGIRLNRDLYHDLKSDSVELSDMPFFQETKLQSNGHHFNTKKLKFICELFEDSRRFPKEQHHWFKFMSNLIKKNNFDEVPCPIFIMNELNRDQSKKRRSLGDGNAIAMESSGAGNLDKSRDRVYFYDYLENPNRFQSNSELFAKDNPTLQIYNYDIYSDRDKTQLYKRDITYFIFYAPESWFTNISPIVGIPKE
jgi:hypothetical protein